ncbi:MAG: protein translocase subunit SecF [Micavibrio sp.]|nr:protein translocase subunit SecF [Micavibrio sp.]
MRFFPQETNINFVSMRFVTYIISAIVLIGSLFYVVNKGPNFGIDFTGGTLVEVRVSETPDIAALRNDLNTLELGAISLQEFGAPDDLLIRLPEQTPLAEQTEQAAQELAIGKVRALLDAKFENVDYRRVEFVGPQVGKELKIQGLYAILFSLGGILLYIWFRFEWQFGLAAIAALAHDTLATVGLFAFTQMEFNLSTVAAILMIAGYSINDTVVVFDRIRENLRKYKKKTMAEICNMSINQTLSRTLMTSVTTMLALVALWVFGGEVIRGFVNALIFGIVIGTYSSIFVAAPVLLLVHKGRGKAVSEEEKKA